MKIDIILPVLNEENRLRAGVEETLAFLKTSSYNAYRVTIVDNGSQDKTEEIAQDLVEKYEQVNYLKLTDRGVGIAVREGIAHTDYELVGYMDIDLSTDITYLENVHEIFKQQPNLTVLTGSRNAPQSQVLNRPFFRELTSKGLAKIINFQLGTRYYDYMCGFKFFRRSMLAPLMAEASDEKGWFYCAELLIYAQWLGLEVYELPVKWTDERENSKVDNQLFTLIRKYLQEIKRMKGQGIK